ncbi:hypothetical protein IGJ41_002778 [Enterococcus sp. DIV1537a]
MKHIRGSPMFFKVWELVEKYKKINQKRTMN